MTKKIGLCLLPFVWAIVAFFCLNSFGTYTAVGNAIVVALIMLFAAWAWWFDEDRLRRRTARGQAPTRDGAGPEQR